MHSYRLQDWYTFTNNGNSPLIVQPDDGWLNLEGYRDYQLWVDVSDVDNAAGAVTLAAQCGPVRDEAMFHPFTDPITISGPGLFVQSQMLDYVAHHGATMPLSKWLRWRLSGPIAAWSITFRIFVSASGPGSGLVPDRLLSRLAD